MDEGGAAGAACGGEGGGEVGRGLAADAEGAEGLGIFDEVGVLQVGGHDPLSARIVAFLVHADGAVGAVVDDHDHDMDAVLDRRGDLLTGHEVVAVAGDADDVAIGVDRLGGDGGGIAIAHGAGGRGQLGVPGAVAVEAVQPGGEIAGAVGQDGVGGQGLGQMADDLAHIDRAGDADGLDEGAVVGVGGGGLGCPVATGVHV